MSTMDRLDVLRGRNKDLLNQLRQHRLKLEPLCGYSHSRKREREDGAEEREDPAEILTLTDGDRALARAALAKPIVRFSDTCEGPPDVHYTIPTLSSTSKHRGGSAEHPAPSDLLTANNKHSPVLNSLQNRRPASTKSCLVNNKERREVQSRVTFQSDEYNEISTSDRHRLQPLLGYDWIAGALDAEDSLIERSDEFFNDLHIFRSLNKDECIHSQQSEFFEENHSVLPLLTDKSSPEANKDTHQCTFSYRINSRLFPVPLHSQECCPVCKRHKSSHPHTAAEQALIRVSIPRRALLPSYKYKAHRRCSFDPSDSLGLPSHCLSGWSNKGQSSLPPPSSLDLRNSLHEKDSAGLQNKELEKHADLSVPRLSSNQISDQTSDASHLCHHNFRRFSPKRKPGRTSYSLC